MKRYLLDSSAVLAVILKERGSGFVEEVLDDSYISAVNFAEVITKLVRVGVPLEDAKKEVSQAVGQIISFNTDMSVIAGELIVDTEKHGLSLGDRACIATGKLLGYEIVTADKVWAKLKLPVKIKVIR